MKKGRVIPAIVLTVLSIVAILAASVYAAKPASPPGLSKPTIVSLTGAIVGTGASVNIEIALSDEFQGQGYGIYSVQYFKEGGSFIANPDYPPALTVSGTRANKQLSYYYCGDTGESHITINGICADESHDPQNYKRLRILGGYVDKDTGDIVWPGGSEWRIASKKLNETDANGGLFLVGTLQEEVRYTVVE